MHSKFTKAFLCATFFICSTSFAQQTGDKVRLSAVDGKVYTGIITDVQNGKYKIQYDGFDFNAWLGANQFTVISSQQQTHTNQGAATAKVGDRVQLKAVDGKIYTGVVKEIRGNQYFVRYDGFDFEAWLSADQFQVLQNGNRVQYNIPQTTSKNIAYEDAKQILDWGKIKGWVTPAEETNFNKYYSRMSADDQTKTSKWFDQANTPSARFFVLLSWLAGDDFKTLQKFVNELNNYPESYQQQQCLSTSRRSIIQQWENTCSVTTIQTYLGDVSPRYMWDVKKISKYDELDANRSNPMALQQKQMIELYGGSASPRGDYSGKQIGIADVLNQVVGPTLGVKFQTVKVTGPVSTVLANIRSLIDEGIEVPLLINFQGTNANHFILAKKYRGSAGNYQYLIYDPWDGITDYVNESTILQGSMSPLLTQWRVNIIYYYPATPVSEEELNELRRERNQKFGGK